MIRRISDTAHKKRFAELNDCFIANGVDDVDDA